jgi:hypothetical protein
MTVPLLQPEYPISDFGMKGCSGQVTRVVVFGVPQNMSNDQENVSWASVDHLKMGVTGGSDGLHKIP